MKTPTQFIQQVAIRLTHRIWNRIISGILCRACGDGIINSRQLHILAAKFDPTQNHHPFTDHCRPARKRWLPCFSLFLLVLCWLVVGSPSFAACGPMGCGTSWSSGPQYQRSGFVVRSPIVRAYAPTYSSYQPTMSYGSSGSYSSYRSQVVYTDSTPTVTTTTSDSRLEAENRQLKRDLEDAQDKLDYLRNCPCDCPNCRCHDVRRDSTSGEGPADPDPFELTATEPKRLPKYNPTTLPPYRAETALARR